MDQATPHLACAKVTLNEDAYERLKGLRATLAFIAHGCQDCQGPLLWDALQRLDDDFGDFVDKIEEEAGSDR